MMSKGDITEQLKKLPQKSGVYIMKDSLDRIIYVGKAVNLRSRVQSYFRESNPDPKARVMASQVSRFEYIITDSELEALIMECNLIKTNAPKYNIKLKDNKAYPYIKLTLNEAYPRAFFTRRCLKDKARYFGPYYPAEAVRQTLNALRKIWPVRACNKVFPRDVGKTRPCLNYHIGRCRAPCNGLITESEYNEMIHEVIQFLSGRYDLILKRMEREMAAAAEDMRYEAAAEIRDKIMAIQSISEKQKADALSENEQDVIALAQNGDDALFYIFFVRGGKICASDFFLTQTQGETNRAAIMAEFVGQFYNDTSFVPKEVVIEAEIDNKELLSAYLSGIKGQNVLIKIPQKGSLRNLTELARKNADTTLAQSVDKIKREHRKTTAALEEIKAALALPYDIKLSRIEAYDISNTAGFINVASMVVFENGLPKRADYRKFKIKTVTGPDDYACIYEALTRRLRRYLNESENDTGFNALPDIIFVDGGKGQMSSAQKALNEADLDLPVCGMVKDDNHKTSGLCYNGKDAFLPRAGEGFKLITRIQDETHRFAIEYHRKLRANEMTRSVLNDIPGIGPVRRKALMKRFGGVEAIKNADLETLAQTDGMNKKSARAVYDFFHKGAFNDS